MKTMHKAFALAVSLAGAASAFSVQAANVAVGRDQSLEFSDPAIVRVEVLDSENNPGGDAGALVTGFSGQNACLVYVYDDAQTLDQDVRLALFDANDNVLGLPIVTITNAYHNTVDSSCGTVQLPSTNSPPVAVDDNLGSDYVGRNVLANDSDPDGDNLSAELATGPQNGTVSLSPSGVFTYTPASSFVGVDSFTYRASDGQAVSNLATVTLEVVAANRAPQAVNDTFGPDFSGANVLANDSDPDGDALQAILAQGPTSGTLQLSQDGTFTYTPDPGFSGEDSFRYRASDGALESNAATVTLRVGPAAGGAPIAVDDDFGGDWRSANLLDNDQFADITGLEIVLVTAPEGGTLSLLPDGSFEYRPFAGFVGADSFSYRLQTASGQQSGIATVSLDVDGEESGEDGVTGKADADGTSVLANASPNELRVSRRIDAICNRIDPENEDQADLLDLCSNLRAQGTTAEQALAALRALTPEELAVIGKAVRVLSFSRFRSIGARMARVREGGTKGISLAGLNLNYGDSQVSGEQLDQVLGESLSSLGTGASGDEMLSGSRLGLWLRGDLSFGEQDRTELESGYDFDAQILTAGVDYRVNDNLFVGASLSAGQVEVEFAESGGDTNSDTYALALYGSLYRGSSYLDGVVSYGWSDVDTRRNIRYDDFGGRVERTASGSTDGNEYYLSLNAGHTFDLRGVKLDPLVRFFYLDGDVDAFTETGAQGLNLQVDDQGFESMSLTASGQLSYTFLPSWGVVTPYVRLEYTYEFEDSADGVRYRFANDPFADRSAENSLRIDVDDPDTSYMVYSAGVAAQFAHGISGFVAYQTLGGYTDLDAQIVSVGMRWEMAL